MRKALGIVCRKAWKWSEGCEFQVRGGAYDYEDLLAGTVKSKSERQTEGAAGGSCL